MAGALDGCVVIQRDLNGSAGEMGQKESCEVQHGKIPSLAPKENNLMPQHSLGAEWLESRLVEKDMAVLVYKLTMGQQCSLEEV